MPLLTLTIQAGNDLSDPCDCSQVSQINSIATPDDWTGACLSFQFSPDNGVTYFDVFDSKPKEVTIDLQTGAMIQLPAGFPALGKCFLKFRSGSRDYPVPQEARRIFMLMAT